MLINLLYISLIVALVFESGFWESMDDYVNEKFKFHHLPHLLMCQLCQCWWLSLLYVIISGNLSLLAITLCLINAHLVEIERAAIAFIKNLLYKAIEVVNKIIY